MRVGTFAIHVKCSSSAGGCAAAVYTTNPASHAYESVSLQLEGEVCGERFADFVETELGRCAGRLLRTKGILAVEGVEARMILQGVADLVELTFGDSWGDARPTSRLVVIGFGLDRHALTEAFARCAARSVALSPPA